MVAWARSSLMILVVLAFAMLVHAQTSPASHSSTALPYQPFGPGVHRTYWLVGRILSPGIGWNGTNPGPSLTANDGDSVSILLQTGDNVIHSWFLDFNSNGVVDPSEADQITRLRLDHEPMVQ